jgi:Tol biopolymer transport system component/tRNA A-37 threonylcarbamoyl transferase component Bud32
MASRDLAPGTRVGTCTVEFLVARGGSSEVYAAAQSDPPRRVALKLFSHLAGDPIDRRHRFTQEAKACARLRHPHVVELLEAGEYQGRPYLITEWVEGTTLAELIRTRNTPPRQILNILLQVADGLAAAHSLGLLHRDLKPANVLVAADGTAKLADFGLAKPVHARELALRSFATVDGRIVGTPAYMSPEQVRGEPLTLASDVYSFGLVLHEALTGQPVHERETVADTLNAVLNAPIPPLSRLPGLPRARLEALLQRCLDRDPRRRFTDARELWVALRAVVYPSAPATPLPCRRLAAALALAAALLLAVTLLVGLGFRLLSPTSAPGPDGGLATLPIEGSLPHLTPDGREVVFRAADPREIWAMPVGPGNARLIWAGASHIGALSLTPDGEWVLFDAYDADGRPSLWEVPCAGGSPRRVATGWMPAVSPSGAVLANLQHGSNGGVQLAVTRRDGSEHRIVTTLEGPMAPIGIAFALDDQAVLVSRTDGLHRSEVVQIRLREGTTQTVASVNGIAQPGLAVAREQGAVLWALRHPYEQRTSLALSPLNGAPTRLLLPSPGFASHPSLPHDGKSLAFHELDGTSELVEMAADPLAAGPAVSYRVLPNTRDASQPRVSPDGSRLAFCSAARDIWVMERDTGAANPLLATGNSSFNPAWSPDGSLIAYSCLIGEQSDLWVAGADGSDPHPLTNDPAADFQPVWHPSGDSIIFVSNRGGSEDLYALAIATGALTRLTTSGARNPAVSPNGQLVAYVVPYGSNRGVLTVAPFDPAGGLLPPVAEIAVQTTSFAGGKPRFSPDNAWVAFDVPSEPVGADIAAIRIDNPTAPPVLLTHLPFPAGMLSWFDWAVDGHLIICVTRNRDRILLLHDAHLWMSRTLR